MSVDELRDLLNAVPFHPFTVCLECDRAFRIADPDFALVTPQGGTLVVAEDLSDRVELVDVALITRVEIEAS